MKPSIQKINIVIDCADAKMLATFYHKLLGWEITHPYASGWSAVTSETGTVIAFQEVEGYEPPVWPWEKGRQAQMLHLDLHVDNLDDAVEYAVKCGARLAKEQFYSTSTTLFDPAGHPFCLDTSEEE